MTNFNSFISVNNNSNKEVIAMTDNNYFNIDNDLVTIDINNADHLMADETRKDVNNIIPYNGIKTVSHKAGFDKPENVIKVSFDFDNKAFAYKHYADKTNKVVSEWLYCRDIVLVQYKVGKNIIIEEPCDVRRIMMIAAKSISRIKNAVETEKFIKSVLVGALIKETNVYGRYKITHNIFDEPVEMRTRQEIVEDNKVYPITINCSDRTLAKGRVAGSSYGALAHALDAPIASDKQAAKYWSYGVGAEAMGLYLVKGNLISFNPLDDANKGNNRIMANNFKYAIDEKAVYSNLVSVLSNGEKTATHGVIRRTIIAPALAVAAQGVAITNDLSEEFIVPKTIRQSVSLETLGCKDTNYNAVVKFAKKIQDELISNADQTITVLEPSQDITLANGTVIFTNNKEVTINIVWNEENIRVRPGQRGFGDEPCTMEFTFHGQAPMTKKNAKYRGAGVKATALALTESDIVIDNQNGKFDDWEILLSSESYKTVEKVLELYANAHADNAIEIINGVIHKDGINAESDFDNWLKESLETYVIKQRIHKSEVAQLKATAENLAKSASSSIPCLDGVSLGGDVEFKSIEGSEYCWAFQTVKGLWGYGNYCVEISTADENYGTMKASQAMQYIQGTFNSKLSEGFARAVNGRAHLIPAASNEDNLALAHVEKEFNLDNAEELNQLLNHFNSAMEAGNNKEVIGCLESLVGKSFRISFAHNNVTWVADVPLEALKAFSHFDKEGNATHDYSSNPDADQASISKVDDLFTLISNIKNCWTRNKDRVVKVIKHYQAHTIQWVKDLNTNKVISNLVKANNTSYMKVVGDFAIGEHEYSYNKGKNAGKAVALPIVYFHSSNPIWKDVKENDVVIMTRVPFPTAVAMVAKKSDKYDRTMAAVAPSIMARSTRGDFDGDAVQFTIPKKIGGGSSYLDADFFNQSVWSLGGYELTKEHSDPARDALRDVYNNKIAKKFSVVTYESSVEEWAKNQELINEVYKKLVPATYGYATDALIKLFIGGYSDDEAKALEVLKLYISYEEDSLGGYNKASYAKIKNFIAEVKSLVKAGHNGSLKAVPNTSKSTRNKFVRGGGVVKVSNAKSVNFGIACAVGYELAKQVDQLEGGRKASAVAPIAISAYAIRSLSRKSQFNNGVNFYAIDEAHGVKHNYSEIVSHLARTQIAEVLEFEQVDEKTLEAMNELLMESLNRVRKTPKLELIDLLIGGVFFGMANAMILMTPPKTSK